MNAHERQVIHPAMRAWLDDHGYTHQAEFTMPKRGRVDFRAVHPDGTVLLIECKAHVEIGANKNKVIAQLLDYVKQLPGSEGAIAVPTESVNSYLADACAEHNFQLIKLDVPARKSVYQHRFNLNKNDPVEKVLHDHLIQLSYSGKGKDWIVATLSAALQHVPNVSPVQRTYGVPKPTSKPDPLRATLTKGKRSNDFD